MGQKQVWRRLLQSFLVSSALGVAGLVSSPNTTQFATSTESPESEELLSFDEIELADDRFVEVDGLRFEVVLSDVEVGERDQYIPEVNTFQVPEKPEFRDGFAISSPENYTNVYITLRVTNQTGQAVFFPRFVQIKPMLYKQTGEPVIPKRFCYEYHPFNPMQIGSIIISPGQTISLVFIGLVYWASDNDLRMGFESVHIGNINNPDCFIKLTQGNFQLDLTYINEMDEIDTFDVDPRIFSTDLSVWQAVTEPLLSKPIRDVWKGKVMIPAVQFQLISP